MAVYFVYRCHDGAPSEKHVRRFEYDTVLDWAQAVWKQFNGDREAGQYAEQLLGVSELGWMFEMNEYRPARDKPQDIAEVIDCFRDWVLEEESHGPHHFQLCIDYDECEAAIYVFDDHFRMSNPGKTDFLLLGWELPEGESDAQLPEMPETQISNRKGDSDGTLYVVSLFADSKHNMDDLGPGTRVEGLRVPGLARDLLTTSTSDEEEYALRELRIRLKQVLDLPTGEDAGFLIALREQPEELTNWGVYSDWLQERGLPPAGLHLLKLALHAKESGIGYESRKPELDLIKVTPHMAQACKHRARWRDSPTQAISTDDYYGQFIFFDDRWAAAHPTLAAGILTFASRWDVLS